MSIKEKLHTILSTKAFHQLEQYEEPDVWVKMDSHERELLSILFIKQGEHQLCQKNKQALSRFELSTQIAPTNPTILHMQAQTLLKFGNELKHFLAAKKKLEEILNPKSIQLQSVKLASIQHDLANVYIKLGTLRKKTNDLYHADKLFSKLAKENLENSKTILWDWALCWTLMGKISGEIADVATGIAKFQLAKEIGCQDIRFYADYGLALIEYFKLHHHPELLLKATDIFKRTIELDSNFVQGWLFLGIVYKKRFYFSENLSDFDEADSCFSRLHELNADDSFLWLQWGLLYLKKGKILNDTEIIHQSIEKFEKSKEFYHLNATIEGILKTPDFRFELESNDSTEKLPLQKKNKDTPSALNDFEKLLYLSWGEAELLLGVDLQDYNYLNQANKKFEFIVKKYSYDSYAMHLYASSYLEIGHYFSSLKHYIIAIDLFQKGLDVDPLNLYLLKGIASAFTETGALIDDPKMFVRAIIKYSAITKNYQTIAPDILGEWGIALFKLAEHTGDEKQFMIASNKLLEAIKLTTTLSSQSSRLLEWYYYRGRALNCIGDLTEDPMHYENATHVFFDALLIDATLTSVRYHLSGALLALGEIKQNSEYLYAAIEQFEYLIQDNPEDEAAWDGYGLAIINIVILSQQTNNHENDSIIIEEAEQKFLRAAALGYTRAFYHLACTHAMKKNLNGCIYYLKKAQEMQALPPIGDIMCDDWLVNIQDEPAFREFLLQLIDKHSDLI